MAVRVRPPGLANLRLLRMGRKRMRTFLSGRFGTGRMGLDIMPETAKPALNPVLVEFGRRIRARREELGLSQEAAAVAIGIHWTQLGKVERGQRSVRVENIIKIAGGLGTTPGALMDGLQD